MGSNHQNISLREAGVSLIDCVHKTPAAVDSGYPYIAIPQIKNGRLDLSAVRYITTEDFVEWTRKADPKAYDVILSRRCNPGETAFVPPGFQGALGQNLVLLRADGKSVFPPFLRWLTLSPQWWEQVGRFINVGAVFDSLRCADIPRFQLPIPPLGEQKQIAHILGSLDDKIELNRQMNQTLEAMAQAIFQSWFVDFEPVKAKQKAKAAGKSAAEIEMAAIVALSGKSEEAIGELSAEVRSGLAEMAGLFGDELVESELGLIPDGWDVKRIEDISVRVAMGPFGSRITKNNFVESGVPVIRGNNLTDGFNEERFVFLTEEKADELKSSNAFPHDIVFTHRGTLGQVGHIPGSSIYARYVISQSQMFLRVNRQVTSPSMIYRYFRSAAGQFALLSYASQVGVPAIGRPTTSLKSIKVTIPPKSIANSFDLILSGLDAKFHQNIHESKTLSELRDSLLPKLLSGELTLPAAQTQATEALDESIL